MLYVYGLTAACLLGLAFVLQQHAAERAPAADVLSFRLLLDLVKVPLWLAGIGCMVAGQLVSVLALDHGELSAVEPLLSTNLIFAMALARRLTGQRLGITGWTGVVLLSGGVAAFMIAGRPSGSTHDAGALRHWLVVGSVLAVVLLLVAFARRATALEPPLLAAAAGTLYGLQDALTRVSTQNFDEKGVSGLLLTWQPYGVIAAAVTGLMLVQSAFETGPLRMSLPSLTASEPLIGIACGIGFLGDTVRTTPGALAGEAAGLAAVVAGVFLLGRHPMLPGSPQQQADPPARTGRPPAEDRE
ncbi:DMT family transporter [Streptomyces sp. NRRL F-5126]|uniref:DMT family transporter n=1 Tax=Streptomyces sp. NRRL F-5126 TaxID=1463857 RepID=UPI0006893980|nr:DMT family transporter [Streptomyces sp. NRRL F-5126]